MNEIVTLNSNLNECQKDIIAEYGNYHNFGLVGETKLIYELTKRGISCYLPVNSEDRIDLIADFKGKLNKIQVKSVRKSRDNGAYVIADIRAKSNNYDGRYSYKYSPDDIDYIAMYVDETDDIYMVPYTEVAASITLRLLPPQTNQKLRIRYADDYTIDRQCFDIIEIE